MDIFLVDLLEILDSVQRDVIYGLLFLVKAEEKPAVVIFLDIIRMDCPVVDNIREGLVLDVEDRLVDDRIKEILEPVKVYALFSS